MDQKMAAISELSKALRKDPQNKLLYCKRADLYRDTEQYQQAIDDYTSAIALDPNDASIHFDRGRNFDLMSDFKSAIKDFTAAIKINPDEAAAYYARGKCYERSAEFKKAIKDFSSAIKINPEDSANYYERGLAYEQLGMADKAKEDFEHSTFLNKKSAPDAASLAEENAVFFPRPDQSAGIRHTVPVMFFPEAEGFEELSWGIGDRVLARWKDLFWYSATILNTQRTVDSREHMNSAYDSYHVLYDDGWQVMLASIAIQPLLLEEHEKVFVRPKLEPGLNYYPAIVRQLEGEAIDVEYIIEGVQEQSRVSRARVWSCPIQAPINFKENDRVFCWDLDGCFYPADVISIDEDEILVHLLFGGERMVTQDFIHEYSVNIGDRIECRWKGAPVYFPCKIIEKLGDRILVHYDDGVKEWSTIRLLRTPPRRIIG